MQFWEDLSPTIKKAVFVALALLVGMLALRYYSDTPDSGVTRQRGVQPH